MTGMAKCPGCGLHFVNDDAVVLRAERDALREFVAALFDASDWPHGGDIDLGTFQGLAVAHGILREETMTAPCSEECQCAEYHGGADGMADGVTCYRKVPWLMAAARRKG